MSLGLLILSCGPVEKEVAVSSVSLNRISAELTVGETLRLSATVSPADATDRTVTWSSSNSSVVTVSPSGEVTAAAVGSANITASAGGKSASPRRYAPEKPFTPTAPPVVVPRRWNDPVPASETRPR